MAQYYPNLQQALQKNDTIFRVVEEVTYSEIEFKHDNLCHVSFFS